MLDSAIGFRNPYSRVLYGIGLCTHFGILVMLSKKVFHDEFSILEERFGVRFAEIIRVRYLRLLSNELTDETFVQGCESAFKTCTTFPSPQQIIDAAPTIFELIGCELKRQRLNGVLPEYWQSKTGGITVNDLTFEELVELLEYLRNKTYAASK